MATVREYDTVVLELDDADLAYLLNLVRGSASEDDDARILQSVTPTTRPGIYELRAGPYVGRLGLPSGRWIDFISRFALPDVIRLILDSERVPIRVDSLTVQAEASPFLVEMIAAAFLRETERLVGAGLLKGYRTQRHLRPPYAGRLDVNYHLAKLAGRPTQLATISRKISTDVPANTLLALALDVLRRIPLPDGLARQPARLAPAFVHVTRRPMNSAAITATVNLAPRRYRTAMALAALLLRSQALAPRGAATSGGSILFFMPKVWEGYVARWVASQWPGYRVQSGYRFQLSSSGLWAEADVVVWDHGHPPRALFDAKYKWPDAAPTRGDLYQMVTYCDRLGVNEATLVYPADAPSRTVYVGDKAVNVLGLTPAPLNEQSDRSDVQVV